jgi:hypothetical protein
LGGEGGGGELERMILSAQIEAKEGTPPSTILTTLQRSQVVLKSLQSQINCLQGKYLKIHKPPLAATTCLIQKCFCLVL